MSALTTGLKEGFDSVGKSFRNTPSAMRKFMADPKTAVGGASIGPLVVLMGHTFIDALDGAGFAVILPDIQKDFKLTTERIGSIGGLALFISFLFAVPVAVKAEATVRRTLYLGAGAVVAAIFAVLSGLAGTVALFLFARSAFGLGLRLNDPVQQSLLADYYPVSTRATVFSARDGVGRAGRLVGPLFFGIITTLFGWRAAIFSVAVPSAILAWYSFRLHNPVRGAPEREAAGLPPVTEEKVVNPPTLREAYRTLKRIGTVRRLWYSLPFLTGAIVLIGIMLPLFMEDVFGLNAAERGFVVAAGEAAAILGLMIATPMMTRFLTSANPERTFPFLSVLAVALSASIVLVAISPNVGLLVVFLMLTNFLGAVIAPAIAVLVSMVVPPRVRTISFATLSLWVLPGILIVPFASGLGDTYGLRWGIVIAVPMFLIGGLILTSSGSLFVHDLRNAFSSMEAEIIASGGEVPIYAAPPLKVRRKPRKPAPQPPQRERIYSTRITPKQLAQRHAQRSTYRRGPGNGSK